KRTPQAWPLKVPSGLTAMRSLGRAGATDIAPAGEAISARDSNQPASSVSASGTGAANLPVTRSISNPSARLAPKPPCCPPPQAGVGPVWGRARHSGSFQPPSAALLTACGSARSAKIRVAVSAMILPLSLTTLLAYRTHELPQFVHSMVV